MPLSTGTLDRYIEGASPIHRLDARVKLLLTLAFILTLALVPHGSWLTLAVAAGVLWLTVHQAWVGLGTIIGRSFVALPFALVAVSLVFSLPGPELARWTLGPFTLTASSTGLIAFVSIVIKSWLSVQAALLLTATTHFTDVLFALRALRLPAVLVAILSFAYRYLFVLVDEAGRMLRAREVRSAEVPGRKAGGGLVWRASVVGRMVGTLFLRAYERSERIYVAMLSRGFDGEIRTIAVRPLSSYERGLVLLGLSGLAALAFLAHLL
ncbi:MAG: cobalt ECF transporter T component CbiQ [Oscillochloris sp.]|nr:cobalt ECF transporter T component CbiQ [Oscillochloris sp.]